MATMTTKTIRVKDGDEMVPTSYTIPENALAFREFVVEATPDGLATIYERYCYAVNLKARGAVRTSIAVVKPVVRVQKGDLDLFAGTYVKDGKSTMVPLAKLLTIINRELAGAADLAETVGANEEGELPEAPRAVQKARDLHVEAGNATLTPEGLLKATRK